VLYHVVFGGLDCVELIIFDGIGLSFILLFCIGQYTMIQHNTLH
jgi:hypothetical protein